MKALARWVAAACFSQYEIYRIYRVDRDGAFARVELPGLTMISDVAPLCNSASPILRRLGNWGGEEATGFALTDASGIVGACWYWHYERYRRDRNFWPLQPGDAKLVEIGVREDVRGTGHATRIVAASTVQMFGQGWKRLFARVWYNHTASLRAFEKAGWRNIALVATLKVRGINKTFRFEFTHKLALRAMI